MKIAYVTFEHQVWIDDVDGLSEDEIKNRAVELFNDSDLDDMYMTSSDIVKIIINDE